LNSLFGNRGSAALLLALVATGVLSCGGASRWLGGDDAPRVHALIINGGGSRAINYQSHLLHVQDLLEILRTSGIDPDDITIFSADGSDPEADLAVRDPAGESGAWRLEGTALARVLRPVRYENTQIPGATLLPARRDEVGRWFAEEGAALRPGDTLLLYVTDHGEKNADNWRDNTITLWGPNEHLSVEQLRAMLGGLEPGTRVVMLMSQCFSGSFAGLAAAPGALPEGNVCGYFSSTAQRPAYGCYPENLGRENVGHSFLFLQALVEAGRFDRAHEQVLYTDATPDVPMRTSEVYLRRQLRAAARREGVPFNAYVDRLLEQAWRDRAAWEPEIRQLDRIGHAFGYFSPRSIRELDEQAKGLPDISKHLSNVSGAWTAALGDVNAATIQQLIADEPDWQGRLSGLALGQLEPSAVPALTEDLIGALVENAKKHPRLAERAETIHRRKDTASAASYRMEVRLAAVIRLRHQLTEVAGRVYLASSASDAERRAYDALLACEALALPIGEPQRTELVSPKAFPPFDEDISAATAALPAWMGVRFRTTRADVAEKLELGKGAADVLTIFPESPAERAGLQLGDVILGPPGEPFTHPNQLRSWTMLSKAGEPRRLDVLREGKPLQITLVPDPYPMKWPELPGPPEIGSAAPPLKLAAYRGDVPRLGDGKAHLLVFWATWCLPCKAALPELEAYAAANHTELIGISDQSAGDLDKFFNGGGQYVDTIAIDEYRATFLAYGVSGTPTFVLVDGNGIVRSYSTGYSAAKSLGIEGWNWTAGEERP
jgi:thiol-disulfide isomerase/thioredoxin